MSVSSLLRVRSFVLGGRGRARTELRLPEDVTLLREAEEALAGDADSAWCDSEVLIEMGMIPSLDELTPKDQKKIGDETKFETRKYL